ncbi:heme-binding domain-containing protein [Chryseobacterium sp. CT-SW4]|uniref:heme-binding domain-containing protein n=1 Tax=Chryseobacterium sp. SW-1 TaxID=3157343 RepID=UPI003B024AFE
MKKVLVIILVAFIIIQFFPIDKTNPPLTPGMDFLKIKKTPPETAKLIRSSCYDCHSNESVYPWYSSIAPSSWFLKNNIDNGRKHLNFSTFATYDINRQIKKLDECVEMIEKDEMPLKSYLLMHQEAKLSPQQKKELISYFKAMKEETQRKTVF